jgi:hypothetical protein
LREEPPGRLEYPLPVSPRILAPIARSHAGPFYPRAPG